jgi:hypothetical protein
MNILQAIDDPKVLGPHVRRFNWDVWRVFLAALFALPLTAEQLALYQKHTGRTTPPTAPLHEAWLVCGRRAGKSFILAVVAVFLACFKDWRPFLGPGEIGTIMVIAADRRQARVIMRYCVGLLEAVPMLKRQIERRTQEAIHLRNRVVVEVHTASFRTTRGYSIVAALLDELAYWPTDENASEPDIEVLNAIRPGMATIPDAMLLCASSPHARRGALWDAHRKHFAKDGDPVLVWQAATRDMNAAVQQRVIDEQLADDPMRAAAEWQAQFRSDLQALVLREAVEACVTPGVRECPPDHGVLYSYCAFCDPSGGTGDSMTLAIGHKDFSRQMIVIDALREVRPPFSPERVCEEFATVLKSYKLFSVVGDRYAGEWPVVQFARFGIRYEQSAKSKSDLYVDLLPLINSARILLLDEPRSIAQLCALERRTARGGRDSIDHPPLGHDDLINAIAGVADVINRYGGYNIRALAS